MSIVTPRPAAAVCLVRDRAGGGIEVFMVRRHTKSTFMPDVYVFPGGSVIAADRNLERQSASCALVAAGATGLGSGYRTAAIRECYEEAGVFLARHTGSREMIEKADLERLATFRSALQRREPVLQKLIAAERLTLATDSLQHWAHWITPESLPVRFDTHFFLAAMPPHQVAAFDGLETSAETWVTPREAIDAHRSNHFPLVIATSTQLEALDGFDTVAHVMATFADAFVRTTRPRFVAENGEERVVLEYDA
jgi:8-oxo-dGTP pyrophosphatase MutT (NUDIX family)